MDGLTEFSWLCVFQEVHELLQDYELKYCYVDRNKRTGERPFQALNLVLMLQEVTAEQESLLSSHLSSSGAGN